MHRNAYLDSAKGLLIFLVVLAHAVIPIRTETLIFSPYKLVYSFHMPAFIFIAGLFSSKTLDATAARKLIERIAVPLVVFEIIHEILDYAFTGAFKFKLTTLVPHWSLWFLVSLFFWRLSTPLLLRLRWPVLTTVVVACIALMAPETGTHLSIARTFSFLPFYALGAIYGNRIIAWLRALDYRRAITAGVVLLLLMMLFTNHVNRHIFFGSDSFAELGLSVVAGLELRLGAYLISAATVLAILAITLQTTTFSSWGRQSLTIYLWHTIVLRTVRHFADKDVMVAYPYTTAILFVIGSALICWVFSRNWMVTTTQRMFRPLQAMIVRRVG